MEVFDAMGNLIGEIKEPDSGGGCCLYIVLALVVAIVGAPFFIWSSAQSAHQDAIKEAGTGLYQFKNFQQLTSTGKLPSPDYRSSNFSTAVMEGKAYLVQTVGSVTQDYPWFKSDKDLNLFRNSWTSEAGGCPFEKGTKAVEINRGSLAREVFDPLWNKRIPMSFTFDNTYDVEANYEVKGSQLVGSYKIYSDSGILGGSGKRKLAMKGEIYAVFLGSSNGGKVGGNHSDYVAAVVIGPPHKP